MPFNSELGMRTFDPLAAYESGQPAAAQAARAFERGQSQADKARQILKRNMAVEAMKIDAAELYSHMEQTPENLNLAQRQAFLKNAAGIWGEETGLGSHIRELLSSDQANIIRDQANEALALHRGKITDLQSEIEKGRKERAGMADQIKLLELARKIDKDATYSTMATERANVARERLESAKDKLPGGLAEDAGFAKYKEEESALQALLKSNPDWSELRVKLRAVQNKISSWELRHGGQEITVSSPSGETVRIGKAGQQPGALTQANLSKVQEAQAQSLRTIDTANRLEGLIDTETVGAQAFAESWVKDRILAQRFPELASQKRAKAEQLASQLKASAVKELRSDSNITEAERKQILEAVPQINNPVDSPARARALVRSVRTMAAIQALVGSKRMGTGVPRSAAMVLDDEELAMLAEQGMITPQMAQAAWKLKREKPQ